MTRKDLIKLQQQLKNETDKLEILISTHADPMDIRLCAHDISGIASMIAEYDELSDET